MVREEGCMYTNNYILHIACVSLTFNEVQDLKGPPLN